MRMITLTKDHKVARALLPLSKQIAKQKGSFSSGRIIPSISSRPEPSRSTRVSWTEDPPDQRTARPLLSKTQLSGEAAPSLTCHQRNELNLWASDRSRLLDDAKETISKFVPLNEMGNTSMPSVLLQAVQSNREICKRNQWNFHYRV
jgi:hypothetical protein